jgi:hypothetical protein
MDKLNDGIRANAGKRKRVTSGICGLEQPSKMTVKCTGKKKETAQRQESVVQRNPKDGH